MASRRRGPAAIQCAAVHRQHASTEQRGWVTYGLGTSSCAAARSQFLVRLTRPLRYGFQSGYKTRVYCLQAVQPTRRRLANRDSSRRFHRAPRSHPTPLRANHSPPPDLRSKPPPSALIAAGGSGRPGRGSSLVTRRISPRGELGARLPSISPHARTGSPRLGGLAVSWVLRFSGQSASRLAGAASGVQDSRVAWRGGVRDRSRSHWAIRDCLFVCSVFFFTCRWGDMWRRDSELGCFLSFRGVV